MREDERKRSARSARAAVGFSVGDYTLAHTGDGGAWRWWKLSSHSTFVLAAAAPGTWLTPLRSQPSALRACVTCMLAAHGLIGMELEAGGPGSELNRAYGALQAPG